jgi:hypothetical protein
MASRQQLQSAFAGMADTLREGFDPSADREVQEAWLGATIRHGSVARRPEWLTIAADCEVYGPLAEQLATITAALQEHGDTPSTLVRLDLAGMAIDLVAEVLDADPCGPQPR